MSRQTGGRLVPPDVPVLIIKSRADRAQLLSYASTLPPTPSFFTENKSAIVDETRKLLSEAGMGGGRVEGQTAFPGSRDGGSEKREEGKGRIMPDKLLIVGFKLFSPLPRIPRWPRKLHPVTITILIFKGSVIRYPTWTLL